MVKNGKRYCPLCYKTAYNPEECLSPTGFLNLKKVQMMKIFKRDLSREAKLVKKAISL